MRNALKVLVFGAALLAAQAAAAFPRADPSEAPDDNGSLPNAWSLEGRERATLHEILDRLRKGDPNYAVIATHLRKVVEDPAFITLTATEKHLAYLLYGAALVNSGQFAVAQKPVQLATEMDLAGAIDWKLRLQNALALGDYGDAARAAAYLARHWPSQLARNDARLATILERTEANPATAPLAADLRAALSAGD